MEECPGEAEAVGERPHGPESGPRGLEHIAAAALALASSLPRRGE